jgi:hypothetical protein
VEVPDPLDRLRDAAVEGIPGGLLGLDVGEELVVGHRGLAVELGEHGLVVLPHTRREVARHRSIAEAARSRVLLLVVLRALVLAHRGPFP